MFKSFFLRASFVCLALAAASAFAVSPVTTSSRAPEWKPITPEELAQKAPRVEPDADAEAIFWDVRIEGSREVTLEARTDTWNHVRVKVFTPKGKEAFSRIDIPYEGRTRVADVAARTIRPDGGVVEAAKDAITDRTLVKAGRDRVKARSIAVPALEPGCLVEYRWREIEPQFQLYTHLPVERQIPVQRATFAFKPREYSDANMQMRSFFLTPPPFERDKEGFSVTTLTDVHSVREEPLAPPDDVLRAWILVSYTDQKDRASADEYWRDFGRLVAEHFKPFLKTSGDVRRVAAEVVGSETDPAKKLQRLFDHCRTKIENVDAPGSKTTAAEREKLEKDLSAATTLSRGRGTSTAVNLAFAALAGAAGFEVRLARVGDRSRFFFDREATSSYFLRNQVVAVRSGETWTFLSPGFPVSPFGQLPWLFEGQPALLCDAKEPQFVDVPATPGEKNASRRRGRFRLEADGTLVGKVEIEHAGQPGVVRRLSLSESTQEEFEKALRDDVTERIAGAELSGIAMEGRDDPEKPFVLKYDVRVPGYATRAGSQLLLPASWFRKGRAPLFPASKRTHPVFLPYATLDEDEVVVELPEGFTLDPEQTAPPTIKVLGSRGEYKASFAQEGRTLTYRRSFRMAAGKFDLLDYASLKRSYDRVQSADELTLALAGK